MTTTSTRGELASHSKLGVWSLLNAETKLALKKYLEA
jgi:hypothetical protein